MAQVVPGSISAVLSKLRTEAKVWRAMETGNEAIHDRLGKQIKAADTGEHAGIEKALQHQASFGGGMCSIRRRRISSASTRSDSAWKLSRMRWRSTGIASEVTSSYVT